MTSTTNSTGATSPQSDRSPESIHLRPNVAISQGFTEEIKHAFMTWVGQPEHNRMRFAAGKYRNYCSSLIFPVKKGPKD